MIEAHRRMLTARLADLTRRLAELETGVPRLVAGDDGDRAVVNEAYELELHARERMVQDARDLSAALDRMDAGTFGSCEDCLDTIPPKRLDALPATTTCVRCATKRERAAADDGRPFGIPREHRPTTKPLEEL